MLAFEEPHKTGGDATIRITEEKAIAWQKNYVKNIRPDFAYNNDEEALEDFIIINCAWQESPIEKEKPKHDCNVGGHKFKPYHTIQITCNWKTKTLLVWKCKHCEENRTGKGKEGMWEVDWSARRFVKSE